MSPIHGGDDTACLCSLSCFAVSEQVRPQGRSDGVPGAGAHMIGTVRYSMTKRKSPRVFTQCSASPSDHRWYSSCQRWTRRNYTRFVCRFICDGRDRSDTVAMPADFAAVELWRHRPSGRRHADQVRPCGALIASCVCSLRVLCHFSPSPARSAGERARTMRRRCLFASPVAEGRPASAPETVARSGSGYDRNAAARLARSSARYRVIDATSVGESAPDLTTRHAERSRLCGDSGL